MSVTLYVAPSGTATSGCATAGRPCGTIQEGVFAAEALSGEAVTVTVGAGTYAGGIVVTASGLASLTVQGWAGALTTRVTSHTVTRGFTLYGGTVTLAGLAIDHGDQTVGGGVDVSSGVTATLEGDAFAGDSAQTGGGVFVSGSATAAVASDTFSEDSAGFRGGGLNVVTHANATVTGDIFSGDSANEYGGGMSNTGGTVTLTGDTFSGDRANYGGGALSISAATAADDTFSNDTAGFSGGGFYNSGTAHLANDTLTADKATLYGGGVLNAGSATLTDVTLSGDTAGAGGGIANTTSANASLSASIVASSTCDNTGVALSGRYDVTTTSSCDLGPTDETVTAAALAVAPTLDANGSTGPETLSIPLTSAAVNEVPPTACTLKTDERGQPRPGIQGQTSCDAGAFELQYPPETVTVTRLFGPTADATAARELEAVFDPGTQGANASSGTCVGDTTAATNKVTTDLANAGARVVVLATDGRFPDALSSQYLAGYLKTGTLLTPAASLSTATKGALRTEGVTKVYVVGGPLAVATAVVAQLRALPAYTCGGGAVLQTGGVTAHVQVTRVWGQTQYDTALAIAEQVPGEHVATAAFPAAYSATNATGGTGIYNDTAGAGSAAPAGATALRTAIVASGAGFQDAMTAGALAYRGVGTLYHDGLPLLLTAPTALSPQVATAVRDLAVQQVIVMGGQLAVTDTVVHALEALGVPVLRVAGRDATDTAVQFARLVAGTTGAGIGWSQVTTVTVTRGNGFTDGLAGAVVSGTEEEPLLLTESPTILGSSLTGFLTASGASGTGIDTRATCRITALVVLGGPLAVSTAAVAAMVADLGV